MATDEKKFGNKSELTEESCSYMIELCTWTEAQGHKNWCVDIRDIQGRLKEEHMKLFSCMRSHDSRENKNMR